MARSRRLLVALPLLCATGACSGGPSNWISLPTFHFEEREIQVSGPAVPGMDPFDAAVKELLLRWNVPGASIAVARGGKLVLARSYGYADFEARQPVQPLSRFRIGSTSKVLTSLAVLHLAEQGRLDLDARFLDLLPGYEIPAGGDARLQEVTVRQLLHHAGGWDRSRSPDYTEWGERIADELGVPSPATAEQAARWILGKPLDFAPGSRFAYSNVGFLYLARVIEAVSGEPYEHYVRDQVLAPMGVLGLSMCDGRLEGRQEEEVKYYSNLLFDSAYPGEGMVPAPYAWGAGPFEGAGGWIASAVDLTRVFDALEGSRTVPFLSAASVDALLADPQLPDPLGYTSTSFPGLEGNWFYGLGLFVNAADHQQWWHGGAYPGSQAALGRTSQGEIYAVVVNSRSETDDQFNADLWGLLPRALAHRPFGSEEDLYPQFPSPQLPPHQP